MGSEKPQTAPSSKRRHSCRRLSGCHSRSGDIATRLSPALRAIDAPASASVFADCPSANALPARSNQAQGAVVKNRLWEQACSRLVRQGSRASPRPPYPAKSVLRKRSDRTLAQARCFRDHIRLIASIIWILMIICYHLKRKLTCSARSPICCAPTG